MTVLNRQTTESSKVDESTAPGSELNHSSQPALLNQNVNQNVYKLLMDACARARSPSLTLKVAASATLYGIPQEQRRLVCTGISEEAPLMLPCDESHALVVPPLPRAGKLKHRTCKQSIARMQVVAGTLSCMKCAGTEAEAFHGDARIRPSDQASRGDCAKQCGRNEIKPYTITIHPRKLQCHGVNPL